jgi:uncharacterized membrane protein YwaF
MRDLFFKLFEMSHFNTGIKITAFSIPHFVYMFLIFGSIFLIWKLNHKKDMDKKDTVLRFLAYALAFSYFSDFFFHEFVYGEMNTDKLPFHICTVLCPLTLVAQFNRKGYRIIEPVTVLAILAPLMYLCYPASIGDGEPWCYQAVQTMFFHGVLLSWGVLNLALGKVKLDIKHFWKCAAMLVGITLWAKLGNVLLEHNWFFLNEDAFYIGLVEGGIIPKWSLMIINPVMFSLAALCVYAIACPIQKKVALKAAA